MSWTYNNRGTAWNDLQESARAKADYDKSIEIDPTNGPPFFNRGLLEHQAGNDNDAIEDMLMGIKLKPQAAMFRCKLGDVLEGLRRSSQAAELYADGLKYMPDDVCLLYHRGRILAAQQHHMDAIAVYSKILQIEPREDGAWIDRGESYLALDAYGAAIQDFSTALVLGPDDVFALSGRAEAYFRSKDYERSRQDCERVVDIRAGDFSCGQLLMRGLLLQNKFQEVIGKAGEFAALQNMPGAIAMRTLSEYALGDYDAAAKDVESAVAADPEDPYLALFSYLINRRRGRDDRSALKELADRNDIWPQPVIRFYAGLISREEVLAATDVPDDAIKQQRRAEANFYLGEMAALNGQAEEADAYYRAAVAIGEVTIPERNQIPLYKSDNDIEIALAKAALRGHAL